MVATPSQTAKSITPDSTESGGRQTLEAGIGAAMGSPSGVSDEPARSPSPPTATVGDPIAALLSGAVDPGPAPGPLTTGLSVGSGTGPQVAEPQSPVKVKLQSLATTATSPLTRAAARNELRRLTQEAI